MEAEIIETCQKLKKMSICANCRDKLPPYGCCRHCKTPYAEYVKLGEKLESLLSDHNLPFSVLVELVNIRDLGFLFVDEIIKEKKGSILEVIDTFAKMGDYAPAINLLSKDNSDSIIDPNYFATIYQEYYNGQLDKLSDDDFIKFFEILAKRIVAVYGLKTITNHAPQISFVPREEINKKSHDSTKETFGNCNVIRNTICLNRDAFLDRRSGDKTLNVITIYHEFSHLCTPQFYREPRYYSMLALLMAKDAVLDRLMPNYYGENYDILPEELNAKYAGYRSAMLDMKMLGFTPTISEEDLKTFEYAAGSKRRMNGKIFEIDEVFDHFLPLINKSCLEQYPILGLEFKASSDGKLEHKTLEEIEETIAGLEQTPLLVDLLNYFKNKKDSEKSF